MGAPAAVLLALHGVIRDPDRPGAGGEGTIKVLLPRSNTLGGQFKGTADAVYQCLDLLQAHSPDLVAVFAADHVYRMDVRQMVAFHRERRADVTVSAVAVPLKAASSFGVLSTTPEGRVTEFREKPRQAAPLPSDPARACASMGNYLFDPDVLEQALHEARRAGETDFGRDVLPRLCGNQRVYAYDFAENRVPGVQDHEERAYWRDVGTLAALASLEPPLADPQRVRCRPACQDQIDDDRGRAVASRE
jgi:glucose-1-phosphate adenylyltransferase